MHPSECVPVFCIILSLILVFAFMLWLDYQLPLSHGLYIRYETQWLDMDFI